MACQWVSLLFLIDAVRRLHLGTGQIGVVLAIGAVGTLFGAGPCNRPFAAPPPKAR